MVRRPPPASIRAEDPTLPKVMPAGPDNPLGAHAIYLGWDAYLIHGTNRPAGVGRRVSHGCIRMYAQDVDALFRQVAAGTSVTVVDQPVKVGWRHGELFLEIHPTLAQVDALEMYGEFDPGLLPDVMGLWRAAAGDAMARVDIRKVWRAALDRNGIPQKITVSDTPDA
jgi:L,D-transpeptidase ErfK/SrfK